MTGFFCLACGTHKPKATAVRRPTGRLMCLSCNTRASRNARLSDECRDRRRTTKVSETYLARWILGGKGLAWRGISEEVV